MTTKEVFRYVSVRSPRKISDDKARRLFPSSRGAQPTEFRQRIAAFDKDAGFRRQAGGIAREHMASEAYVAHPETRKQTFKHILPIRDRMIEAGPRPDSAKLITAIEGVLGQPLREFLRAGRYRELVTQFWDGLIAHVLAPTVHPEDREDILTGIRVLHGLGLLITPADGQAPMSWKELQSLTPVLPRDVLPVADAKTSASVGRPSGSRPSPNGGPPEQDTLDAINRLNRVIADIRGGQRRNLTEAAPSGGGLRAIGSAIMSRLPGGHDEREGEESESPSTALAVLPNRPAWYLDNGELPVATRDLLVEYRLDVDRHTVPELIEALEGEVARNTERLYTMLLGRSYQPPSDWTGNQPVPRPEDEPQPYRILGIGDLEIVRETLLRYEPNEVAHIENVLQSETRSRTHEWLRETEETFTVKTERTDEVERDLQSTERFELQRETERTIETETKVDAGVNVSAKYGTVNVTTSGNFAHSTAKSESDKNSSTFARDITERTVQRISNRVREERVRRTLEQVKERNFHSFNNTDGPGHVRGIYQWVDKIYQAQVVNYGRRLMLEFIVPEPAAFSKVRTPEVPADDLPPKPIDPVVPFEVEADGTLVVVRDANGKVVMRQLEPKDLTATTYQHWVAAYGVRDATPPPPEYVFLGGSLNRERTGTDGNRDDAEWAATKHDDLVVPDGYRAIGGWLQAASVEPGNRGADNLLSLGGRFVDMSGQPAHFSLVDTGIPDLGVVGGVTYKGIDGKIPLTTRTNTPYISVGIEVLCQRTPEKLEQWQLATFASIMTAYEGLLQAYRDGQRRGRGLSEIIGQNPLRNAQIVRDELKKSCITLMTGWRFDDFNAVSLVGSLPEIDLDEVKVESAIIQFVEQAFEWSQMTYLFYPYFWGRKQHWLENRGLDDPDPAYADFLRAGAARVIVPVRPAYEADVPLFLASEGQLLGYGGDFGVDDDLFVSIVDEMRSRQGAHFVQGPGTVDVVDGNRRNTGRGTAFDADHDVDREIMVNGATYRIQEVRGPAEIMLTKPYVGASQDSVLYSLGPQLVDLPWEVRVPTSLVYLNDNSALPNWTAERAQ